MTKATKDLTPAVDGETLTAAELDAMPEPNAEDEAVPDAIAVPVAAYDAQLAAEILTVPIHPLDMAPVNSKVVCTRLGAAGIVAVLATPDGVTTLPADDPASALPDGARIRKTRIDEYVAEQLSPAEDYPPLVTSTASAAIAGFLARFHPAGA